ncbi:MAG: glycosyltransferase family 39 protein [Planctomycetota bacterium]
MAPSEASARRRTIALVGVLVVATVLRAYGIGARSLWADEANTLEIARLGAAGAVERLRVDASPPLYYALLHVWSALVGTSEAATRALSALFGVALVAAVHRVGARRVSTAAGLWAAAYVAVLPSQVFHSQQLRMYTLLPLLALLSTEALARLRERPRAAAAASYAVLTALALLTHNAAFFLLPLHAAMALRPGARTVPTRHLVGAALGVAFLYAPWAPSLWEQLSSPDTYSWYRPNWGRLGTFEPLTQTLGALSPEARDVVRRGFDPTPLGGASALAAALVVGAGLVSLVRSGRFWTAGLFVVPLVVGLAFSKFVLPVWVPGRIGQLVVPGFALAFGAGLAAVRGRALPVAIGASLLLVSLATDVRNAPSRDDARDERALAEAVLANARAGDVVIVTSIARPSLAYYLAGLDDDVPVITFPRYNERHMGWLAGPEPPVPDAVMRSEADAVVRRAAAHAAPDGRIFCALLDVAVVRHLERALENGRVEALGPRIEYEQTATGIRLWLVVARPAAGAAGVEHGGQSPPR